MNYKTTIALLSIVALFVLGFAAVKFGWVDSPDAQKQEEQSLALSPDQWKPDKVTRIIVKRPGQADAVLRRRPSANGKLWQQVEPVTWALNDNAVQRLLLSAGQVQRRSGNEQSPDPKDVDLDQPSLIINLGGDQPPQEIALGKNASMGFAWASINGGPPVTITRQLHEFFERYSVRQMRDPYITSMGNEQDTQITLIHEKQTSYLNKVSPTHWEVSPLKSPVEMSRLNQLRQQLAQIQLGRFITDQADESILSNYGLIEPTHSIQTMAGEKASPMLMIGNPVDDTRQNFYARLSDTSTVFTLSNQIVSNLIAPVNSYRSMNLSGESPELLTSVVLTRGTELKVEFLRRGNQWAFGEKLKDEQPNLTALASVLQLLFKTPAANYTDTRSIPAAEGHIKLAINAEQKTLNFSRLADGQFALWMADTSFDPAVYLFNEDQAAVLFEDTQSFVSTQLLSLQSSEVKEIQLIRNKNRASYLLKPLSTEAGTRFGFQGDQPERSDALLKAVLQLKAEKWVNEDSALFDQVLLKVTTETHEYELRVNADKRLGRLYEKGSKKLSPTFQLPESLVTLLLSELRDPVMIRVAPNQIESIQRNQLTLKADPTTGRPILEGSGPEPRLNIQAISQLYTTIIGLNAEHILTEAVIPGTPTTWSFMITTKTGRKIRLNIWQATVSGQPALASVDEGPLFTLTAQSYQRLSAVLTE